MFDPGAYLAIVSLALQATQGLLVYYELWKDGDDDIIEIQRSLLWLANIFTRLDITLRKPNLQEDIVSIIRITMKSCGDNVKKLQELLQHVKKEGTPQGLRAKFKTINRKVLYIYHNKEIRDIKALLDELREDLKLVINLLNLNTSATSLDDLRHVRDELSALKSSIEETSKKNEELTEKKAKETMRTLVMNWLVACDISTVHLSALEQREPGTGLWFLNEPWFSQWQTEGSQHLWIAGDVGCGKTVLCASIIEELRLARTEQNRSYDNIIYFYFSFNDSNRQDISAFLRSALAQLCVDNTALALVEAECRRCSPDPPSTQVLIATFLEALNLLSKAGARQEQMDAVVEPRSRHTYIILDGLDEVPYGPQRSRILRFLEEISCLEHLQLHLLVCSRQERDVESALLSSPRWRPFRISQSNVEKDLDVYITNQIAVNPKLQTQPKNIREEIKNKLVRGAGGMFRWASLQMQELKMMRILRSRDIKKVLSSLPKDLDSTYERILASIDPSLADEATAALKWLAYASRPLFLEELAEACIIRPDNAEPFEEDQRLNGLDILELLPGLTRIDPAPDPSTLTRYRYHTISLAHFSVMEYLSSRRILTGSVSNYCVSLSLAQRHITRSCLAYIAHVSQLQPASNNIDTRYPLSLYAYTRWPLHAALVPKDSLEDICADVLDLFRSPKACLEWSACVLRTLNEKNQPIRLAIPFDAFKTPLWPSYYLFCHAVVAGNEVIVKRLLDTGLQVRGASVIGEPLKLAITSHYDKIATLILAAGCQPSKSDVLLAVRYNSEDLVLSMMKRLPDFGLTDTLIAVNVAVSHSKFRYANSLMGQLFSGNLTYRSKLNADPGEMRAALCSLILRGATQFNSSSLISYLLQYLRKDIIGHLDMGPFFLRAIVERKEKTAEAFHACSWVQLSKANLKFQRNWNGVMVPDEICIDLLELYYRCCQLGASRQRETSKAFVGRAPRWNIPAGVLKSSRMSSRIRNWTWLFESFEAFHMSGSHPNIGRRNVATGFRRCLRPSDRLLAYQILTGPHSSTLWTLYRGEMTRRHNLKFLTSYVTEKISPEHKRPSECIWVHDGRGNWSMPDVSRLLRVQGKAGCGKRIPAIHFIDPLPERETAAKSAIVATLFRGSRKGELQRSRYNMPRSTLCLDLRQDETFFCNEHVGNRTVQFMHQSAREGFPDHDTHVSNPIFRMRKKDTYCYLSVHLPALMEEAAQTIDGVVRVAALNRRRIGVDVNSNDRDERTPLLCAVGNGRKVAKLLLAWDGSDADFGDTYTAVVYGMEWVEAVVELLDNKADPDDKIRRCHKPQRCYRDCCFVLSCALTGAMFKHCSTA